MKWPIISILILTLLPGDFNRISSINAHKQAGEQAYRNGQYESAIDAFRILVDSLQVRDESVMLNLANAYFHASDTTNAAYYYARVTERAEPASKSAAYNQLGIIDQQQGNMESALAHFKRALKTDPGNENARYNYELLKKMMQQQQNQDQQQDDQQQDDQQQDDQQQDQEKQDQQKQQQEQEQSSDQDQEQQKDQEQQEQEQQENKQDAEKKDQGQPQQQDDSQEEGREMDQQPEPSRQEKLEELNLTEEKARMILEAMRNNEMQYLQQMQRKPQKKPDANKPDW